MSLLGDILDNREGRLSEMFTEAGHKRAPKGATGGGQFISSGASGTAVRRVQRKVGAKVDGQFGTKTKSAIEAFQRKHGLQVDGVIGHQTAAALRGNRNARHVTPGALTHRDRSLLGHHTSSTSSTHKTKTPPKPPKPYTTNRGRASYTSKRSGGMVA